MIDEKSSKRELLDEIQSLRKKLNRLEQEKVLSVQRGPEGAEPYGDLVEKAGDAIYRTDAEGHFTYVNPVVIRLLKYSRDELIGKRYFEVVHPDYVEDVKAFYRRQLLAQQENTYNEFPAVTKNNTLIWIGQNVQSLRDGQKIIGFQAIARDITERKNEQEINQSLSNIIEQSLNEIYVIDPQTLKFIKVNKVARRNLGYTLEELKQLTPLDVKTSLQKEELLGFLKDLQEGSKEKIVFESRHKRKDGSSYPVEVHLQLMRFGMKTLAVTTILDITERENSIKALKQSELRFRKLTETATDAIITIDEQGLIVVWNEAASDLFGYSAEEAMGQKPHELLTPDDLKSKAHSSMAMFIKSGMGRNIGRTIEMMARKKDGSEVPVELSISAMKNGGGWQATAVIRDISGRKKDEERLRKLSKTVEQSPATVMITDIEGNIEYVNPKFTEISGYDAAEVLGKNPRFLKGNSLTSEDYKRLWETITSGEVWRGKFHNRRKDGSFFWEEATIGPIIDEEGRITHFIGLKVDISDRVQAEQALQRSEEQYRSLVETMNDGVGIYDSDFRLVYANDRFYDIVGYSQAELLGRTTDHLHDRENRAILAKQLKLCRQGKYEPYEIEFTRKDGKKIYTIVSPKPIVDDQGRYAGSFSIVMDITARREAEQALKQSEEQYRRVVDSVRDIIFQTDMKGNWTFLNRAWQDVTGYNISDCLGKNFRNFIYPEDEVLITSLFRDLIKGREDYCRCELRYLTSDGAFRWADVHARRQMDDQGQIIGFSGVLSDITDRKQAEEALKHSQKVYKEIFDFAPVGIYQSTIDGKFITVNKALVQLLGYGSAEELLAVDMGSHIYADEGERQKLTEKYKQDDIHATAEVRWRTKDGRIIWVLLEVHRLRTREGEASAFEGFVLDITERVEAERALHRRERILKALAFTSEQFLQSQHLEEGIDEVVTQLGQATEVSRVYIFENSINEHGQLCTSQKFEWTAQDMEPQSGNEELQNIPYSDSGMERWQKELQAGQVIEGLVRDFPAEEQAILKPQGIRSIFVVPIFVGNEWWGFMGFDDCQSDRRWSVSEADALKATAGTLGVAIERARAEQALQEKEERYRTLFDLSPDGIVLEDDRGNIMDVNPAFCENLGYTPKELIGKHVSVFSHPDAVANVENNISLLMAGNVMVHTVKNLKKDGSISIMELNEKRILLPTGQKGILCIAKDITEKVSLQAQLNQAQKMEAVGRLAGGVAHDFNNILTVINGYSSLLLARIKSTEPYFNEVSQIHKAGDRARTLVNQLLAFSRKQVIQPKILNLNNVVADTEKMLQRLIGEDIELVAHLEPGLANIKADPVQIDQILVNLAVNARDVMPSGGKLTIETRNITIDDSYIARHMQAKAGQYVMMSVTDIGSGMDEETLSHIFEPFFTTKEKGKGTGLGLSTVYGIVQQSKGYIWVYSEPGQGTTFKIYFPVIEKKISHPDKKPIINEALQGSETILIVEDDDYVRELVVSSLENFGYTLIQARNGKEALHIIRHNSHQIDLLLTDVVMPKMGGRHLVDEVQKIMPELKVLFMSGYTDDQVVRHGVLDSDINFIQKPFSTKELAIKVRQVIDRPV